MTIKMSEEQIKEILRQRAISLSKPAMEEKADGEALSLVSFVLVGEHYGIDIRYVKEILKTVKITPLPCSEDHVLGIINVRGEIIVILDLKKILGLVSTSVDKTMRVLIVEDEDTAVGILLESLPEVIDVRKNLIEPPLATIKNTKARYVIGEAQIDNKLLAVLNIKNILS